MQLHQEIHPKAGQVVKLKSTATHPQHDIAGADFLIEDWWDHLTRSLWMTADGNPACLVYGLRVGMNNLPANNDVVYGKVGAWGVLIHSSEIEDADE